MVSRALAHHRAAMDGLGGGFCVFRCIGSRDDWIVVEANTGWRLRRSSAIPSGASWS
jgi:hypothetical protein